MIIDPTFFHSSKFLLRSNLITHTRKTSFLIGYQWQATYYSSFTSHANFASKLRKLADCPLQPDFSEVPRLRAMCWRAYLASSETNGETYFAMKGSGFFVRIRFHVNIICVCCKCYLFVASIATNGCIGFWDGLLCSCSQEVALTSFQIGWPLIERSVSCRKFISLMSLS